MVAGDERSVESRKAELDDLKITLKENIELGRVVRLEAGDGEVLDSYLHVQGGRGVNGVLVVLAGGDAELAHDIAVHIAFARPKYLTRDEVPADVVDAERDTLETITRNEGKPEAALPKIVEGRLQGFFKDVVLLDQPYAKDDKQSVAQVLGDARRSSQLRPGRRSAEAASRDARAGHDARAGRWRRIVFKPSGEALAGPAGVGHRPGHARPDRTVDHRPAPEPRRRRRGRRRRRQLLARPRGCRTPAWTPPSPTTSACSAR